MHVSQVLAPRNIRKILRPVALLLVAVLCDLSLSVHAGQVNLAGPAYSGQFGSSVTVLPNGNFVVTDPGFAGPGASAAGAVYLYDGGSLALISQFTGSSANDRVGDSGVIVLGNGNFLVNSTNWNNGKGAVTWISGSSGLTGVVSAANSLVNISAGGGSVRYTVTVLSNNNYVVSSPGWNNGSAVGAGAATWGSGTSGVTGAVSAANSLVGTTDSDGVGETVLALANSNYVVLSSAWNSSAGAATWANGTTGIQGQISAANSLVGSSANGGDTVGAWGAVALNNGNYVVLSPYWHNGAVPDAGAVTWGNGASGVTGAVSAANSLVGTTAEDQLSLGGIILLTHGDYVVSSPYWHNGAVANAGAVTWGSGTAGVKGIVSPTNSLVGTNASDYVGVDVISLPNGNYVVASPIWHNGTLPSAGAVTWCNGTTGRTGAVSTANSLVGSAANDSVGGLYNLFGGDVNVLSNGNYVVQSPSCHNGAFTNAGAVTWCNGTTGRTGIVSATNSLVGASSNDQVGYEGITLLNNGNYVVSSGRWHNGGASFAGSATWCDGGVGITGMVSSANSLVGIAANDGVGVQVTPLNNGNYVVSSPDWHNGGLAGAGAATWGSGTTGVTGVVSAANSLVGTTASDFVGSAVTALSNGNYVVSTPDWHNGAQAGAGAVTWGNGASGGNGQVSAVNSLVGTTASDGVGDVTALGNGNYVVGSPLWHNGALANAGAVTWGNGVNGIAGAVSAANSLVGVTADDQVGSGGITTFGNTTYFVSSPHWYNGALAEAGAVTWGNGTSGTTGPLTATNSFLGTVASGGNLLLFTCDSLYDRLLVGYPGGNLISLFGFTPHLLVQQPANDNLSNGSTRTFGAPAGAHTSLTFTLKNGNVGDLTGLGVNIDGPDAPLFNVTTNPAVSVAPLDSTTFTVRFAPSGGGSKTAALHIISNDAGENPFNINLSGKILSFNEDTDGDGMSDAAEFELAALGFDWQLGQTNLVNLYYSNANGAGLYSSNQIQALSVNSPLLTKNPQTGLFTLTIGVEKSTNLFDYLPFPMTSPQTTINGQGELEFQFSSPDNAAFFRLESH